MSSRDCRSGWFARNADYVFRIIITAALLLAHALTAASETPCKVFDPELQRSYTGDCRNGLAEGYGEARGAAHYRGEFRAGRKHGKGVKTWPATGDRYEGEFVEDRKEGTGIYTWGRRSPWAGQKYVGGFLNDRRHGYGVLEWPNGERYEGPWEGDAIVGPLSGEMIARARTAAEHAVVVGRRGTRVCRQMEIGIGVREWVRGTVMGVEGERVSVRIDEPGRFEHRIGDEVLEKGGTVSDSIYSWTPCS
jgi:hypothetical protein